MTSFKPDIYVPGLWRCPKCGFRLMQSNLNAGDGTVTARDDAGDKCPNDGVPLWRVTWREEAQDAREAEESAWEQGRLAGLREAEPIRQAALDVADFLINEGHFAQAREMHKIIRGAPTP